MVYEVTAISGKLNVCFLLNCLLYFLNLFQGTFTILNLYSAHMNPDVWENPNEFMPERFLNERREIVNTEKMFPFGQGMCKTISFGHFYKN